MCRYLISELWDIMLSILYVYRSTYIHITAAIIGEMVKSSTFHDINKCITASEQMIINVGSDNICQVEINYFTQKIIGCTES